MGEMVRILHVDDEPDVADTAARFLEREAERFVVETATGVEEGLGCLGDDIDCVVSDYEMPGRNGIEFLSAVREEYPDLPFILFTGKGSEEIASEAISAGVTDYLRKRIGPEQYELLATRIRTAVGQYRAEQELERQNDLFEKAQDLADVGAWEWNPQERTGHYTEQVYEIYGVDTDHRGSPEEDIRQFYHPEDRETVREAIREAVQSGQEYDIEVRVIAADGTEKWVRTLGEPQFEDGTCTRVRGTIRDITERKERERDLEQQRTRLTVALEGSRAGVWEWVPETNEVVWHESTERLFGLESGSFEGTYEAFARHVHDEDIEVLESAIEEALPDYDPFEAEYRIHRTDGTVRWAYARGEFVDIEGLSPRYIGVITDITERKERERDLEQTTEWYQTLLDAAPDAVFVADAESGVIRETNQAATRLLDRPRDDIVGMHQTELHPPEKVEEYAELFEKHVASGAGRDETLGQQVDIYVLDADGERIPVEINARTVDIEGEHLIQGYFRDITDRKQRERELQRQNERLDEFVSVVSHDLRNPLQTLSASLELIETDDQRELGRCRRSVQRMEQLLDDLLTLARHGETDWEETRVDLADVARESAQTAVSPGVSLSVETEATVVAERTRLRQLFENLFSNAIDHGGDDVSITVGDIDDGFYVEDDGVGIPENRRERCFDIGYSTNPDGTGFGLNIVKQVVGAHGWTIRVTDSNEGGARFEITGVETTE